MDSDTLRRAVELAPGFTTSEMATGTWVACDWGDNGKIGQLWKIPNVPPRFMAALASALVEMVDAMPVGLFPDDAPTTLYNLPNRTDIWHKKKLHTWVEGPNRDENTIAAIVQFMDNTGEE